MDRVDAPAQIDADEAERGVQALGERLGTCLGRGGGGGAVLVLLLGLGLRAEQARADFAAQPAKKAEER